MAIMHSLISLLVMTGHMLAESIACLYVFATML